MKIGRAVAKSFKVPKIKLFLSTFKGDQNKKKYNIFCSLDLKAPIKKFL